MKKLVLLAALCMGLGFSALAEDFTVVYKSGDAYLITGNNEEYIDIGSTLQETSRVFVEDGGILELEGRSRKLTIAGPGNYTLSALLRASKKREATSRNSVLGSRIGRLISGSSISNPSSVMGVRGSAVDDAELTWMSGESQMYIDNGREYLKQGKYARAQETFLEGLEIAEDFGEYESEMELTFLLSYSQAMAGHNGRALGTLASFVPDSYVPWYSEYRLHHAQLMLNAGNPAKAAELMQTDIGTHPLQTEEESLLLGIALYETGGNKRTEGKRILTELASGQSATAPIARAFLSQ